MLVAREFNDKWTAGAASAIGDQVPFHASSPRCMLVILTRAALLIFRWKVAVVFVVFVITPVKRYNAITT